MWMKSKPKDKFFCIEIIKNKAALCQKTAWCVIRPMYLPITQSLKLTGEELGKMHNFRLQQSDATVAWPQRERFKR